MNKVSLEEKFALFSEHWRPKTIAALKGQKVKLVKVQGEFPWHHHEHEDKSRPDRWRQIRQVSTFELRAAAASAAKLLERDEADCGEYRQAAGAVAEGVVNYT
jgi:hypothetical protein